jgi:hypothetical protein
MRRAAISAAIATIVVVRMIEFTPHQETAS